MQENPQTEEDVRSQRGAAHHAAASPVTLTEHLPVYSRRYRSGLCFLEVNQEEVSDLESGLFPARATVPTNLRTARQNTSFLSLLFICLFAFRSDSSHDPPIFFQPKVGTVSASSRAVIFRCAYLPLTSISDLFLHLFHFSSPKRQLVPLFWAKVGEGFSHRLQRNVPPPPLQSITCFRECFYLACELYSYYSQR